MGFLKANAVGLGTTDTTGRNAGVGTATGTIIYNVTDNAAQVWTGSSWSNMNTVFTATGGTKIPSATSGNGYIYHVFLYPNSDTFSVSAGTKNIEILLVAGGGSGGNSGPNYINGGGGGAGGVAYASAYPIGPGTYPISVGSGGISPYPMDPANPSRYGGNTTFTDVFAPRTITALGGGAGGSGGPGYAGLRGGNQGTAGGSSGGGAGWGTPPGGIAAEAATQPGQPTFGGLVTHFGNTGGPSGDPSSSPPLGTGGGGGGAGTPAPPNVDRGGQLNGPPWFNGPGGPGQPFTGFPAPIIAPAIPAPVRPTWTPAVGPTGLFGGGGGAGAFPTISTTVGSGGPGGGGAGSATGPGPAAVDYTGGGGGGNGHTADGNPRNGGAGGHGILLIRYQA